ARREAGAQQRRRKGRSQKPEKFFHSVYLLLCRLARLPLPICTPPRRARAAKIQRFKLINGLSFLGTKNENFYWGKIKILVFGNQKREFLLGENKNCSENRSALVIADHLHQVHRI